MRIQIVIALQLCLVLACAQRFADFPYQAQTAKEKMDQLWKEITADQTSSRWFSTLELLKLFTEDMKPSFDLYSDILPQGRKKFIHTVGAVAQAELISEPGNPYTGMFQGVSEVLVRLSTAKEADGRKSPQDNFIPGMGIKLLRDGMPSANLIAMYSVNGQDSFNFFKYDWSNHIPNPKGALVRLGKKFAEATPYIGRMGLKTWAQYDEKGQKVEDSKMKLPFKLLFRPTSETHTRFPDTYAGKLVDQLKTIPAGTALWDILAIEEPRATPVKIATIKTKSALVTSKFGDTGLFFQHNYIEDDIELHPNWKQAIEIDPPIMGQIMSEFHK